MKWEFSLECPKCGLKTEVKKVAIGYIQRCNWCQNVEYYGEKSVSYGTETTRILCPETSCTGLLGSDGFCRICGRYGGIDKSENSDSLEIIEADAIEDKKASLPLKSLKKSNANIKNCPHCDEEIKAETIFCGHCGEWLSQYPLKIETIDSKKAASPHRRIGSTSKLEFILGLILVLISGSISKAIGKGINEQPLSQIPAEGWLAIFFMIAVGIGGGVLMAHSKNRKLWWALVPILVAFLKPVPREYHIESFPANRLAGTYLDANAKSESNNSTKQGANMNDRQRNVLVSVGAIIFGMLCYPPFRSVLNEGKLLNNGYHWLWQPPTRYATVDITTLIMQWVGILIVGGIAFFVLKER